MKWEYHFYQAGSGRDFEQAEETMNNLGRTGWELVTTYTDLAGRPVFVFKRHLSNRRVGRHLRLRLVTRLFGPCRQNGKTVMGGEILIGAIDAGS
jgi:imidazoleglycerol phosphate dehydratase HisB